MKDFFGQQEQARRNTAWLFLLFGMAVIVIVFAVYAALSLGLLIAQLFVANQGVMHVDHFWSAERFVWVVAITSLIVASGSLYRSWQLRQGGGAAVAEMLGGKRLPASTDDLLFRRVRHVVEEMAIASGMPVPPIYLLEQSGINAFAAGYTSRDAVIAVTRGAIELLNRDELQGVIAHEFSHILNGDTRLKMHLMGLLFGITLISDSGIMLMTTNRSTRHYQRDRSSHPAMILVGFLIFLVGTIGAVFADLIKRAVSRQREFLADAAAVQFTRNPAGIAGALKVIGGFKEGARVQHAATEQASHFFFGNAVKSREARTWWATHPPLAERIRRLDPSFSGSIEAIDATARYDSVMSEAAFAFAAGDGAPEALKIGAEKLVEEIGNPTAVSLDRARQLMAQIPAQLRHRSHDPYSARAIVYGLLLDSRSEIRAEQLKVLEAEADANVYRELLDISSLVLSLTHELRLPLLEMAMPALKSLSRPQFDRFRRSADALIRADADVGLFEYMLQRMLLRHLYPVYLKAKPTAVHFDAAGEIVDEVAILIALLMKYGAHQQPEASYQQAMRIYSDGYIPPLPKIEIAAINQLDAALMKAEAATPAIKKRLLKAVIYVIRADGRVAGEELELLRAICDAIDLPLPAL